MEFLIESLTERDDQTRERLYWSNEDGWTDRAYATRYTYEETKDYNVSLLQPGGGRWAPCTGSGTYPRMTFATPPDWDSFVAEAETHIGRRVRVLPCYGRGGPLVGTVTTVTVYSLGLRVENKPGYDFFVIPWEYVKTFRILPPTKEVVL